MKTLILLAVVAFVLSTALVHLRSNDYIEESDTGLQLKEIGNDFTVEHIGRWFMNNSTVTWEKLYHLELTEGENLSGLIFSL